MHFQLPKNEVEVVVGFGARADETGRDALNRRSINSDAVSIQGRAGGEGDRGDFR